MNLNESPVLQEAGWNRWLKGWTVTDCAIRDRNIMYVLARKVIPHEEASLMWDNEIPVRLVAIYPNENDPGKNHGGCEVNGFNKPRCGVSRVPIAQGLIMARSEDADVYAVGGGRASALEVLDKGKHPNPLRLKCIAGYTYAVCQRRTVYKRVEPGKWVQLTHDITKSTRTGNVDGFSDIDGPSEQELYAVGGNGDVWHYNGKAWTQCAFPSNEQLSTVVYAPDGRIYIGGEAGNIWVGSQDTWKKVFEGTSTILYNDMAWFDERLWVSSDYGLRVWDGETLERPRHQSEQVIAGGHMDVYDGVLFIAGPHEALTYDGTMWRTLVKPFE